MKGRGYLQKRNPKRASMRTFLGGMIHVKKRESQNIHGIDEETPLFTISVVSRIFGIHKQTLRIYDREGLVCPNRTPSNRRLYSEKDIRRLEYVCYLVHERGVNISGAKIILEMLDSKITNEEGDDYDSE
jgi:hypothetical protein